MPATEPQGPLNLLSTLGDTGLKAYGGFVTEEYLPELVGQKGLRTYRRMANDATIGAILFALKALVSNVEWTVQSANSTPEAEQAKEWLEGVIEDMDTPISDVISEACTMFVYGFAPCEVTYKVRKGWKGEVRSKFDDGKLGVRSIELRGQTSLINWDVEPKTGQLRGMNQLATWKGSVYIPRKKLALFRCDSVKDNPESTSLLRTSYRAWFFKSKMEEIEAIGAERNNAGIPHIRIPAKYLDPAASPTEKAFAQAWSEVGRKIRRDQQEFILSASDNFPESAGAANAGRPMIDVQLLTPSGKTFDISSIITRYDQSIARAVLMQFIFLGSTSAGSFALSSNQTELFSTALGAYLKRMAATLNRDVVDVLWDANEFPHELRPTIVPGDVEKPDMVQLMQVLAGLAGAGATVFPDPELENFVRK
ncbi:MAG: hypothetical protein EBZ50_05195, partial [Alphaproteobacteria bacterium]|nr:hypothetical protein [Alphaproteobacteria bacterium]